MRVRLAKKLWKRLRAANSVYSCDDGYWIFSTPPNAWVPRGSTTERMFRARLRLERRGAWPLAPEEIL